MSFIMTFSYVWIIILLIFIHYPLLFSLPAVPLPK